MKLLKLTFKSKLNIFYQIYIYSPIIIILITTFFGNQSWTNVFYARVGIILISSPYQLIQADIMYLFIAKIMGNKSPQEDDSWADSNT